MLETKSFEVLVDHADKRRDRVAPNPNRRRLVKPRDLAMRELERMRSLSARVRDAKEA